MVGDIGQPSHCIDTCFMFVYLSVYIPWDMLDITLLLLMIYVLSLLYISMLMVRYYRYYTVVAYDICVMAHVGR